MLMRNLLLGDIQSYGKVPENSYSFLEIGRVKRKEYLQEMY